MTDARAPHDPERLGDPLALDADALSRAIHARRLSCRELMAATLDRIARLNPRLNAIVALADRDRLLREADARDAELARGTSRGWLHGLPIAVKDTASASGFPTTLGCALLRDNVAAADSFHVARMKAAGAIVIGKTTTPEFGLGSHTYSTLHGATPNAWDRTVTAGGSSGGAAVALAQRLVAVADGSDVMGSLRNPAGWNHVFGMRPSFGRVPAGPKPELWLGQLATDGPMARTVRDLATLLSLMAGHEPRAPLSLADGSRDYIPAGESNVRGLRIGWLGDLGGHLAIEPGVREVCERALSVMAQAGAHVEPSAPGFDPDAVWPAWLVWRHVTSAPNIAPVLARPGARELLKPEALWEHDRAERITAKDFVAASVVRSDFLRSMLTLFERFDLLALPSAQCWPFGVTLPWPQTLAGRPMDTYHRWMEVTLYATFAGLPAVSVPAGFDPSGRWPMGLQLIGPPLADAAVLRAAAGYEALVPELLARRPPEPV